MWGTIWHGVFFDPIYNGLIFLVGHVQNADVGIAIILLTIAVKIIMLPISIKAAHAQHAMRFLEPELTRIKEKYKDAKEELARQTMAAYKSAGVNPFASIFFALIQIPIIIALYFAVSSGGGVKLPGINTALLYSFVPAPETISMLFLGLVDMSSKSIVLALLAGISQYIFGHMSLPPIKKKTGTTPNFKEDLTQSMQLQMKYAMPVMIGFTAYYFSAAVALYFVVSNVMSIAQEYVVRAKIPDRHREVDVTAEKVA